MDAAVAEPLFRRILGEEFDRLPQSVRQLHRRAGPRRYHGEVVVERGSNPFARLFAAITRLPPAGQGSLQVDIDAGPRGECWNRHIGGRTMPSRLWERDGLLCERLGPMRFGFRLRREAQVIVWSVVRVHVLGIVPLPAAWFDGVRARESEAGGRYCFDVRAALPLVGLLVHYRGWLDAG